MNSLNPITSISSVHHACIIDWKKNGVHLQHEHFLKLVEENHAFNYQLWHAEDRARRDDLGHEWVSRAKREIDHYNQQRNNRMESMDEWLFKELKPAPHTQCPVHSETPGMMIDRLSILALKVYHMTEQSTRQDVNNQHRATCLAKLHVLDDQRQQLQTCLEQLYHDVMHHRRTYRVYHQFKMYNDPTLNPQLYGQGGR
jgi:hypothetical protein